MLMFRDAKLIMWLTSHPIRAATGYMNLKTIYGSIVHKWLVVPENFPDEGKRPRKPKRLPPPKPRPFA
jgi:hypothetical protein